MLPTLFLWVNSLLRVSLVSPTLWVSDAFAFAQADHMSWWVEARRDSTSALCLCELVLSVWLCWMFLLLSSAHVSGTLTLPNHITYKIFWTLRAFLWLKMCSDAMFIVASNSTRRFNKDKKLRASWTRSWTPFWFRSGWLVLNLNQINHILLYFYNHSNCFSFFLYWV